MLITEDYRKANSELHERYKSYGIFSNRWAAKVRSLVEKFGVVTILDYGCGKGSLKASLEDLHVAEYDPAIPGKDQLPDSADLVVCTDVLEHIEPDCLAAVFDHISSLTRKAAFLNISTRAAGKFLADGRNAHLIIEPASWWREKVELYFTVDEWNTTVADEVSCTLQKRAPAAG